MKKIIAIMMTLLMVLSLAGCNYTISKKSDTTDGKEVSKEKDNSKVTVTPGSEIKEVPKEKDNSRLVSYGFVEKIDDKGYPIGLYEELTDIKRLTYVVEAHDFKTGDELDISWYMNGDELIFQEVFPLEQDVVGNYLQFYMDSKVNFPEGDYYLVIAWGDNNEFISPAIPVSNSGTSKAGSKSYIENYGFVDKLDENGFPVGLYDELTDVQKLTYVFVAYGFKSGEELNMNWYKDGDELIAQDSFPFTEDIDGYFLQFYINSGVSLPDGEYHAVITWGDGNEFVSPVIKIMNSGTPEVSSVNINPDVLSWHASFEYNNIVNESDQSIQILDSKPLSVQELMNFGYADPELEDNFELYILTLKVDIKNAKYYGKNGAKDDSYFSIIFRPDFAGVETVDGSKYFGAIQDYGFEGCLNDKLDEATEKYSDENYTLSIETGDKLPQNVSATGKIIVVVEKNTTSYLRFEVDYDNYEYKLIEIPTK